MEENTNSTESSMTGFLEGKTGGWVLNVVIVALVIAGLMLPPVSAQERIFEAGYTSIDRDEGGSVTESDGMQASVLPEGLEKNVKVKLETVPMASFLDGSAGNAACPEPDLRDQRQGAHAHRRRRIGADPQQCGAVRDALPL
jgi:hypothetical protein